MKQFTVYIMSNYTNSVLYTGSSGNPKTRFNKHTKGFYPNAFTKKYKVHKLVWMQEFNNPNDMIEAERKIKGWTRAKKIRLIKSTNPEMKDLL